MNPSPHLEGRSGASAAPPRWRLRLLGAVELLNPAGLPVRLPTRAVTVLLARLALAPQQQHAREELIGLLWPDADVPAGQNRLRQALSVLRTVLEDAPAASAAPAFPPVHPVPPPQVLMADRRAIWLLPQALASDVQAFKQAVARADWAAAAQLHQGDLLPGHFDEWVLEERAYLAAQAERAQAHSSTTMLQHAPVADTRLPHFLTRLIGFEAEGASLAGRVQQHRLVVLRGPGGAGKTRLAVEVARAVAQRADGRLQAARGDTETAFDMVAFVPLASCTLPAQMVDTLLHVLRHEGGADRADAADTVAAALAGRRVLLVLDNFEQLVASASNLVAQWLSALPLLHLLVTSRHALGLDGEVDHALPALPLPAPDADLAAAARCASVALFADRARASRADFELHSGNITHVVQIVRALHGLPLAIELAAARLRSLDLASLHQMLVTPQRAGAGLTLLARDSPRRPDDARQASMVQVLQWSWQQLGADEQALLSALAACEGGAGLALVAQFDALATQVALPGARANVAALALHELVAASVVYLRADATGVSRYLVFEPMREFIFMQAGAARTAVLRAQHAAAVARWAAATGVARGDGDPALGTEPTLEVARAEWGNLVRALQSGADPDVPAAAPQQALETVLHLRPLLEDLSLPPSALAYLRLAVAQCSAPYPEAALQGLLAYQSFEAGQREAARAHAQRALAAPATPAERADALRAAARVLLRLGHDLNEVLALADEAIALARTHQCWTVLGFALTTRSVVRLRQTRDLQANVRAHEEVVTLWRTFGPQRRLTSALAGLALALGFVHRVPEQLLLLDEVRTRAAQEGQQRLLAFAHSVTGYALADQRRYAESAAHYRQCLQLAWDRATWREWFYALWNLPRTLAHLRRPGPAAQLMGFAEAFYAERFGVLGAEDLPEARRTRRLVAAQLGAAEALQQWQQGGRLGMAGAMQLALQEAAAAAAG